MIDTLLPPVLLCAGLTAALVAGVFLTFSDFLMRALGETAPAAGAEAMQRINVDVFRSVFMVLFLGSVPLALLLAATGLFALSGAPATWVISGAGLYVVGVFAVTALGNVPMNAHLARLEATSQEAGAYWAAYQRHWTGWNHVRTAAAIAAALCYLSAAMALA